LSSAYRDIVLDIVPPAEPAVQGDVVVELTEPRDGTPRPLITPAGLRLAAAALRGGNGPVAVDAERASGYRYGQRAYLVQLRRAGAGTFLIDPSDCPDLAEVDRALADVEWVLHAASQDLPCLAALNLRPRRLFDTELAGRLAGFDRVGLGAMVEQVLGLRLEKGHSAADWSTRPLPEPWLRYAALDVEVLVELRDALELELAGQGKLAWAREEFAALVAATPPAPRAEPWRRTSGVHRLRSRRQLAAVRELWDARDDLARRRDLAPGRVLPDAAIVSAALAAPTTATALLALPVFGGRSTRRHADRWLRALDRARTMAPEELPSLAPPWDGPPPGNRWADRDPAAAARLTGLRTALAELAATLRLPTENLVAPDAVRRLAWSPPAKQGPASVADFLRSKGVREWQIGLTADLIAASLASASLPAEVVVTGR
jgi:ribonuclease D